MKKFQLVSLCAAGAMSLSGCAELTHLTRERPLETASFPNRAILVDAKQRAITSVKRTDGKRVVCAEPSPDAMSVLAASQGLSISKKDKLDASGSNSLAESGGSIGLRTQSIQLMRDAMYRICEAYQSGAIDGPSYETLLRRFQGSMVGILAIEQLTGATQARQVVFNTNAGAGDPEAVKMLTEETVKAQTALDQATSDLAEAKAKQTKLQTAADEAAAAFKKTPDDADAKTKAEATTKAAADQDKVVVTAESTQMLAKQTHYAYDQARKAALSGVTSAGGKGDFAATPPMDPKAATEVAQAVQGIVDTTLGMQFSNELCTTVLLQPATVLTTDVRGKCGVLLDKTANRVDAQTQALLAVLKYIAAHPDLKPDEVQKLLKGVEFKGATPMLVATDQ